MADNKQVDSRIDANSSSPRQVYGEQQIAITDRERTQQLAEARAAEAAVQANRQKSNAANPIFGNASGPTVVRDGISSADFGGNNITITPAPTQPKPRASRRGK